jgi:hypothetical protein
VEQQASKPNRFRRSVLVLLLLIGLGLVALISFLIYIYSTSPDIIRRPSQEHYHFRMQIIVDGRPENFALPKYQEGYSHDNCNVALTTLPIHFHDSKNQIVHIHWEGMTGGMVLKYYGWNYIGGQKGALGYRFDKLPQLIKAPIHGYVLPEAPTGDHFYIYQGDSQSYKERSWNDFLNKDLERFFGKTSTFPAHHFRSSALNSLFPKVYAQEADSQDHQLTQLNNLIGNVVIFAQPNKPSDAQVKDRFNHLEPLSASVCGG